MKLIAKDSGKALQLIIMEEVRPLGGIYMPKAIDAITNRYEFVSPPDIKDPQQLATEGYKFHEGRLQRHGREIVIKELGIYSDGILVSSDDTEGANIVMDDLIGWMTETFELREPITRKQRTFTSTLIIEFESEVEALLKGWETIQRLLSGALKKSYDWDYRISLGRLSFSSDPELIPPLTNTLFILERREGVSYSANRFYSGAPLRTNQHIELLEALEKGAIQS